MIGPTIKSNGIVVDGLIHLYVDAAVGISAVVTVIGPALVVVGAARIFVAVVKVPTLHIAGASALGKNSRVIVALDDDTGVSVDPVVNIHPAPGVMQIANSAVGAALHCAAIP